MTHLTLLGALVVINAMLRHLTNWRFIIIIIIILFEGSYWQTRSIVWPLCNSRATCKMLRDCFICFRQVWHGFEQILPVDRAGVKNIWLKVPKGTSLHHSASIEASCLKVGQLFTSWVWIMAKWHLLKLTRELTIDLSMTGCSCSVSSMLQQYVTLILRQYWGISCSFFQTCFIFPEPFIHCESKNMPL